LRLPGRHRPAGGRPTAAGRAVAQSLHHRLAGREAAGAGGLHRAGLPGAGRPAAVDPPAGAVPGGAGLLRLHLFRGACAPSAGLVRRRLHLSLAEAAMQYLVTTDVAPDLAAIEAALQGMDPAALLDRDPDTRALRISTWM